MSNYPAGVSDSSFAEDTSHPSYQYINQLTGIQQKEVCLEYLEAEDLGAEYEDWRTERGHTGDWLDGLRTFCEAREDFWEWME